MRIAWADKAPQIIREDAQRILALSDSDGGSSIELARIPLLNTVASGYSSELAGEGKVKPAVTATLILPRSRVTPEIAATVCDASMEQQAGPSFSRGDVVLLTREEKIKNGSIIYMVYSMRQKRQALIRQVMLEQGDHIVLQPLNKEFPLEFLTHDDVDAVYRVVGKVEMFESAGVDVKI